jgi:hypothetical protein
MVQYRATRCNALQHMKTRAGRPTSEGVHAAVQSTKGDDRGDSMVPLSAHEAAPGLGSPLPHLQQDWGSPLPHLRRDWAHSFHICVGTGLTAATCSPRLDSQLLHLRWEWAHPHHIFIKTGQANEETYAEAVHLMTVRQLASCTFHLACCRLRCSVVCCVLFVVCCVLRVVCRLSSVALLHCCTVVCCVLRVACCLLFVAHCALRVAH